MTAERSAGSSRQFRVGRQACDRTEYASISIHVAHATSHCAEKNESQPSFTILKSWCHSPLTTLYKVDPIASLKLLS